MKRSFLLALLVAVTLSFTFSSRAGSREAERIQEGKITKNEAQHLALKQYPGATIKSCQLKKGKEHGVWMIDLVKAGAQKVISIQVDGLNGTVRP